MIQGPLRRPLTSRMLENPLLLIAAFLLATAIVANAEPQYRPSMGPQLSAVPTSIMMPNGRAAHPANWYYDPSAGARDIGYAPTWRFRVLYKVARGAREGVTTAKSDDRSTSS